MVVWYCDVDISEDANLTEGDMHLARALTSTPPSAQVLWRSRSALGTPVLLDRGGVGRQRGLRGHGASLIVIYKKMEFTSDFNVYKGLSWRVFRLFSSFIFTKSAVMWFSLLYRYFKFVLKNYAPPLRRARGATRAGFPVLVFKQIVPDKVSLYGLRTYSIHRSPRAFQRPTR